MFLAKAIERIDPTRGNNATPKEEIAIRPLKMEQKSTYETGEQAKATHMLRSRYCVTFM